jgi:hypothetical protein
MTALVVMVGEPVRKREKNDHFLFISSVAFWRERIIRRTANPNELDTLQ